MVGTIAAPIAAERDRTGRPSLKKTGVLVGAAVALVVSVTGAISAMRYQPLVTAGLSFYDGAHRTIKPPGALDVVVFRYDSLDTFVVGFSIHNDGPFAVTVRAVPVPESRLAVIDRAEVYMGDGGRSEVIANGSPLTKVRFEPFTLEAGAYRYLEIRYRFGDCDIDPIPDDAAPEHFYAGTSYHQEHVVFEFLGLERTATLDLPHEIGLEAGMGACTR